MSESNGNDGYLQVAAELKRVRDQAGLSQEQMATKLGMDYAPGGRKVSTGRATVSLFERGRRLPSASQLQVYLELGGDPAILTPAPPAAVTTQPSAAPAHDDHPETEPGTQAGPSAPLPPWWRRHGLQLAAGLIALLLLTGVGTTVLLARGHHGVGSTWTETTGSPAHTWSDATQLSGAGTPLGPRQSVQVSCRMRGYVVQDGDPWWYRLASAPWNDRYYATSDAFYNNGHTSGSFINGIVVDQQVPLCPGSPQ